MPKNEFQIFNRLMKLGEYSQRSPYEILTMILSFLGLDVRPFLTPKLVMTIFDLKFLLRKSFEYRTKIVPQRNIGWPMIKTDWGLHNKTFNYNL